MANIKLGVKNWKVESVNRWADYIELSCFCNSDKAISIDDFFNDFTENLKTDMKVGSSDHPKIYDTKMEQAQSYFSMIRYRIKQYDKYYPFEMDDKNYLEVKKTLSAESYYYLYLLIASNTCFIENDAHKITSSFELLSKDILKSMKSINDKTFIFGTSGDGTIFKGNLRERIQKLASMLKTRTTKSFDDSKRFNCPGGDGGLDLVSFYEIDENRHIPLAFAQCSCSYEDWIAKQYEVDHSRWSGRFEKLEPFSRYMFVPFDYREVNGVFENPTEIHSILIDRYRFKILIEKERVAKNTIMSVKDIVENVYKDYI